MSAESPRYTFQVVFSVSNLETAPGTTFLGRRVCTLTPERLKEWQVHGVCPEALVSRMAGTTAVVVEASGDELPEAVAHARRTAELWKKALQFALARAPVTEEEDLLFEISSDAFVLDAAGERCLSWSWLAPRISRAFFVGTTTAHRLREFEGIAEAALQCGGDIHQQLLAAIRWMGRAVDTEDCDEKVLHLSAALGNLLAERYDGCRRERLTYRLAILIGTYDPVARLDLEDAIFFYGLHSGLAPGSTGKALTSIDYMTLSDCVHRVIDHLVEFAVVHQCATIAEVTAALEASSIAREVLGSFERLGSDWDAVTSELRTAIESATAAEPA